MSIVYFYVKGSSLTAAEVDGNFQYLDDAKVDKVPDHSLVADTEIQKLSTVEQHANAYEHPATHPATMVEQTPERRFVTDIQISEWDSKQDGLSSENPLPMSSGGTYDGTSIPSGYNQADGLVLLAEDGTAPKSTVAPKTIRTTSTTGNIQTADFGNILRTTNYPGSITLTLPPANAVTGRELILYKNSYGVVNIHTDAGDTIANSRPNGTIRLWNQNSKSDWVRILSVGNGFLIDGFADFTTDYDLAT